MAASHSTRKPHRPEDGKVVHAIKELILERGLQSGEMLPSEAELTEILQVSRSSIREAIKVLSTLDIVEVRHGIGTYVSNMSLQPMVQSLIFRGAITSNGGLMALGDVIELREKLDTAYAAEVVKHLAGRDNHELHALVAQMEDRAAHGRSFLEFDREFHKIIAKKTNNLLLLQLVEAFWDIEEVVYPKLGAVEPEQLVSNANTHRELLEAAEASQVSIYRKLLAQHYAPLRAALPRPNYFPDESRL